MKKRYDPVRTKKFERYVANYEKKIRKANRAPPSPNEGLLPTPITKKEIGAQMLTHIEGILNYKFDEPVKEKTDEETQEEVNRFKSAIQERGETSSQEAA